MSRHALAACILSVLFAAAGQAEEPLVIDESKYHLPGADATIPAWVGTRKDEPFQVKEFLESRAAPAVNAAPLYLYAMSRFANDFAYLVPEEDRPALQERSKAILGEAAKLTDRDSLKEIATSPEVEAYLPQVRPYLKLVDQAQQRPQCVFISGLQIDSLLPHAQTSRSIARMCQLEIANACARSDFKTAEAAESRVFRMSRDIRPRGMMISQLVSCALDAVMVHSILNDHLSQPSLTFADCDRLLDLLQKHQQDPVNMYVEGLKMEFVMEGNIVDGFQKKTLAPKTLDLNSMVVSRFNFDVEWKAISEIAALSLAIPLSEDVHGVGGRLVNQKVENMRKNFDKEIKSPLNSIPLLLGTTKLDVPVLASILLPATSQFGEACRRHRARLQGVILFTAVRRYQLKHGRLPETLLVAAREAGIQEIPIDPYDGQPMRYVVIDGKPVVYSVAIDRVDDGGQTDWEFGKQPGDFLFK